GELSTGGDAAEWSELPVHRVWAEPLLEQFVDRKRDGTLLLDSSRLTVSGVILPTFKSESESYFGLSAEYRMKLPIPFFKREIVLTSSAVERCWVGERRRSSQP